MKHNTSLCIGHISKDNESDIHYYKEKAFSQASELML